MVTFENPKNVTSPHRYSTKQNATSKLRIQVIVKQQQHDHYTLVHCTYASL